ncbi:hypothetical protein [Endozoicomonas arenosclerae]|uniref:hypothetical protein n=1 Tax=Endozoicomonas arenosclerae TaxID=1633495 RepID=UPI000AD0EC89|nr:hypothetical protein [Endozoicomonas arenosclerae]
MKLNAWILSLLFLVVANRSMAVEYQIEDATSGEFLSRQELIEALVGQQHIIVTWDRSDKQCIPSDSAMLNEITGTLLSHHWLKTLVLGWVENHSVEAQLLRKHPLETSSDSFIAWFHALHHPLFQPSHALMSKIHAAGIQLAPGDFSFRPFIKGMSEMPEMTYLWATAALKDHLFQQDFKSEQKAVSRLDQIRSTLGEGAFNDLVNQFPDNHTVSSDILTRRFNSQIEQDEGLAWHSQSTGQLAFLPFYTHARKDIGFVPYLRKLQPFTQVKVVLIVTKECWESSKGYAGVDYLLIEY